MNSQNITKILTELLNYFEILEMVRNPLKSLDIIRNLILKGT